MQSLLLWYLLTRRYPGILKVGRTLFRSVLSAAVAGVVVVLVMQLPFSTLLVGLAALVLGAVVVIPFVWPEIKLLLDL